MFSKLTINLGNPDSITESPAEHHGMDEVNISSYRTPLSKDNQ